MVLAVEVDPMIIAGAIVFILAGTASAIVTVINAWFAAKERHDSREYRNDMITRVNDVADKADTAAKKAEIVADKSDKAHEKLDSIKATAEKAAIDVNGNLKDVRQELIRSQALNQSMSETIAMLIDTVKAQRTNVRSTDPRPPSPPSKP